MQAVLPVALLVLTLAACGAASTSSARRSGSAPVMSNAAFTWCQANHAVVDAGLRLGVLHNPMRGDESKIIDAIFAEQEVAVLNVGFVRACNAAFESR